MIPYVKTLLSSFDLATSEHLDAIMKKSMLLDLDMGSLVVKLKKDIGNAPKQFKTKFKNAMHGIATR